MESAKIHFEEILAFPRNEKKQFFVRNPLMIPLGFLERFGRNLKALFCVLGLPRMFNARSACAGIGPVMSLAPWGG